MYVVVFEERDVGVEVDTHRYSQDEQYRVQIHAALRSASRLDDPRLQDAMEVVITELILALSAFELDSPDLRDATFVTSRLQ